MLDTGSVRGGRWRSCAGVSLDISVADVRSERVRLQSLGLEVSEIRRCEGAVEVVELTDPDGSTIGFVTELV